MAPESAQVVSLVVVTIAVLLQTIFLIQIAVSVAKIRKSFDVFTTDIRKFLGVAARSGEILNLAMAQMSQTVKNRLRQADDMAVELLARSRTHALEIDRLISNLLHTAEYANQAIDQLTTGFFREVDSLNAGIRAAAGYLFSNRYSRDKSRQTIQKQ